MELLNNFVRREGYEFSRGMPARINGAVFQFIGFKIYLDEIAVVVEVGSSKAAPHVDHEALGMSGIVV